MKTKMGKMKELFIEQMNNSFERGDEDYDYESYEYQKAIEELNEAIKPKYAEADIKYVLDLVLGDANSLNEQILYELNELYNLRNDF
jgi:hypothetical protein